MPPLIFLFASTFALAGEQSLPAVTPDIARPAASTPVSAQAAANFSLVENSANGTVVGTVKVPQPGQTAVEYAINAGNLDDAFAIDPRTGQLTVRNTKVLSASQHPVFHLTIEAKTTAPRNARLQKSFARFLEDSGVDAKTLQKPSTGESQLVVINLKAAPREPVPAAKPLAVTVAQPAATAAPVLVAAVKPVAADRPEIPAVAVSSVTKSAAPSQGENPIHIRKVGPWIVSPSTFGSPAHAAAMAFVETAKGGNSSLLFGCTLVMTVGLFQMVRSRRQRSHGELSDECERLRFEIATLKKEASQSTTAVDEIRSLRQQLANERSTNVILKEEVSRVRAEFDEKERALLQKDAELSQLRQLAARESVTATPANVEQARLEPEVQCSSPTVDPRDQVEAEVATPKPTTQWTPPNESIEAASTSQQPQGRKLVCDNTRIDVEDPNSVKAYMERLLAESRGNRATGGWSSRPADRPSTWEADPTTASSRASFNTSSDREVNSSIASASWSEVAKAADQATAVATDEADQPATRVSVPASVSVNKSAVRVELNSLREVAKLSAHSALQTHASKRHREQTLFLVVLAIAASVVAGGIWLCKYHGLVESSVGAWAALGMSAMMVVNLTRLQILGLWRHYRAKFSRVSPPAWTNGGEAPATCSEDAGAADGTESL